MSTCAYYVGHVPLNGRKALAARVAFETAVHRARKQLKHEADVKALNAARRLLDAKSCNVIESGQNDESLTSFLNRLVAAFQDERGLALVKTIAAKFEEECAQRRCEACQGGHFCDGTTRDDGAVDKGGLCIREIKQLFLIAQRLARNLYLRHCPELSEAMLPEVTFATAPATSRNDFFGGIYAVGGVTGWRNESQLREPTIGLVVHPASFDWPSYLATLYVLCHEWVCHAYQSLLIDTQPMIHEPSDAFCEGWMDVLAYHALRRWMRSPDPEMDVPYPAAATSFLEEALRYHSARVSQSSSLDYAGLRRAEGKEAVENLAWYIEARTDAETSWRLVMRLSTSINVRTGPSIRRNDFVSAVAAGCPGPHCTEAASTNPLICRAIDEYIKTEDPWQLWETARTTH